MDRSLENIMGGVFLGYFAIGEYITKEASLEYTIMLDKFYFEQCVVMMRKSSVYTDKLNVLIGRLHQSGLMLAWETQVTSFLLLITYLPNFYYSLSLPLHV